MQCEEYRHVVIRGTNAKVHMIAPVVCGAVRAAFFKAIPST